MGLSLRAANGRKRLVRRLTLETLEGRQLFAADVGLDPLNLLEANSAVDSASAGHSADVVVTHQDELHFDILPSRPFAPAGADVATKAADSLAAGLLPLSSIPALSSLAEAAATVYLDFNGHFESVWGSFRNISTPVFDQDGDLLTFSSSELTTIQKVWSLVAEDFAPFNVNVTTVDPGSFANGQALRVSIGGDGAWLGHDAGGVGYIDSFTNSIVNTVYVFPEMLANGYWRYVGEAATHEAGHGFGLEHQSRYSSTGTKQEEYHSGTAARAPIMGNSYDSDRGVWWSGTSSDGVQQNDVAVLSRAANGFGYRPDDHSNSSSLATVLVPTGNQVSASGLIHVRQDLDYFSFETAGGAATLSVAVPAGVNNLDARLELRNAAGTLIASAAPTTSFGASISTTLATGSYRLVVASEGNYGDLGQYTVSGTIVPADTTSTTSLTAPSGLSAVRGSTGIVLAWIDQADGESAYYVERRVDGGTWNRVAALGADSAAWLDASALAAGANVEYRVQAADGAVLSPFSNVASLSLAPAAPATLTASAASSKQVNLTWTNVAGETGYAIERAAAGGNFLRLGTASANVTTWQDATATAGTTYQYRVKAFNSGGESPASPVASVTTPTTVTRPLAPSGLTAVALSPRQVQLTWQDNSTNEQSFLIQRSTNRYNWTTLGSVTANTTSVVDATAVRGRLYYYRVFATNAAGRSAASNLARVVMPYYASGPRTAPRLEANAEPSASDAFAASTSSAGRTMESSPTSHHPPPLAPQEENDAADRARQKAIDWLLAGWHAWRETDG